MINLITTATDKLIISVTQIDEKSNFIQNVKDFREAVFFQFHKCEANEKYNILCLQEIKKYLGKLDKDFHLLKISMDDN